MTCRDAKILLNAYVDGELDSAGSISVEEHVQRCTSCVSAVNNLRALGTAIQTGGLRYESPTRLRNNVLHAIRKANPDVRRSLWIPRWAVICAAAALLVAVMLARFQPWKTSSDQAALIDDIVSSHIRSTMANHITDVSSSDSHTVKPWFAGKLDYSPPAKDLTEQGFRLVGGRLDYLDKRPVAALVYQRSQHLINLFVWPSTNDIADRQIEFASQGYNLIHWSKSGMSYWLISELNRGELTECARLLME
jgi:anti-sigma factor RsiW